MLRASGQKSGKTYELRAVVEPSLDAGVAHGAELLNFSSAIVGADETALEAARRDLDNCMGPQSVTAAATIAATFSLVDRAANGVGIWVEPMVLKPSAGFREELGINQFLSAQNTLARSS